MGIRPLLAAAIVAAPLIAASPLRAGDVQRLPLSSVLGDVATGYVVIIADSAAVHAAPDPYAPVLQVVDDGDVLPFEAIQGPWYRVVLDSNRRGYLPGGAAAQFFYPQYLFAYQPPEDWTPPSPFWEPPPDWVPPPNWIRHPDGWRPPPRWRPKWWRAWFNRHDERWEKHRRDWEGGRNRDWGRSRDRDEDRDRGRDRDRNRGRGKDSGVERR